MRVLALILQEVENSPQGGVACGVIRIYHAKGFWVLELIIKKCMAVFHNAS